SGIGGGGGGGNGLFGGIGGSGNGIEICGNANVRAVGGNSTSPAVGSGIGGGGGSYRGGGCEVNISGGSVIADKGSGLDVNADDIGKGGFAIEPANQDSVIVVTTGGTISNGY
ncbi:MAG: hypothetical protein LBS93_08355, partial [Synergistaceae bacterium]|nr:hypothetical protein [Synergistaceae bacterium]